jgi:hypothetical protein
MAVGLDRCPEYGIGYGWYSVYVMGLWIVWKGTSCTDCDCGWFRKVPGVRFGMWSVLGVRNGLVDGLERYLVYRLGLWMVLKGARSTIWLMIVSVVEARI